MNEIIGRRDMTRTLPDGTKKTITIEIGKPEPMPEGDIRGNWFATSRILGIKEEPETIFHYSLSSLDALSSALSFQGTFLSGLPFAHEIEYAQGHNFLLPVIPIPQVMTRVNDDAARLIPKATEYANAHPS